jgi:hypothetical protein
MNAPLLDDLDFDDLDKGYGPWDSHDEITTDLTTGALLRPNTGVRSYSIETVTTQTLDPC